MGKRAWVRLWIVLCTGWTAAGWSAELHASARIALQVSTPTKVTRHPNSRSWMTQMQQFTMGLFSVPNAGFPPEREHHAMHRVTPHLALPKPLAEYAFYRIVLDKREGIVGEQVTAHLYLYTAPDLNLSMVTYSSPWIEVQDCVHTRKSTLSQSPLWAEVGGQVWKVQPISSVALFPLKAGKIQVGPFEAELLFEPSLVSFTARSATEWIQVDEPPRVGRPAEYSLGDVGEFVLTASVSPRTLPQGESVSVVAELSGVGFPPRHLVLPVQAGVDWFEVSRKDETALDTKNVVGGKQVFSFLVQIDEKGEIPLGDLTLPYWSLQQKRYRVARASLGTVQVHSGSSVHLSLSTEGNLARLPLPYAGAVDDKDALMSSPKTEMLWWGLFGLCTIAYLWDLKRSRSVIS